MPDRIGRRTPVTPAQPQHERARQVVRDQLIPLWETSQAQPIVVPPTFRLQPHNAANRDFLSRRDIGTDNRWAREHTRLSQGFSRDRVHIARPYSEQVPTLVFELEVPNGTYEIGAYSAILPGDPLRGSSFTYTVPGYHPEPQLVFIDVPEHGSPVDYVLGLGTFTITGNRFEIHVGAGRPEDNAVFGHLMFRTVGAEALQLSAEELDQQQEQLRALGYVE
jgi:hypothetical protein